MISFSVLSTEYFQVPVEAKNGSGTVINPTGDAVQFAFTSGANPAPGDWKTGSWATISEGGSTVYLAQCLVGPAGAAVLAVGTWYPWIKVTDNPEIPVRQVGLLQIT